MASLTLSVSDDLKEWIDRRVVEGEYGSASDYIRDLVRRDRESRLQPDLTLDDLRLIVAEARASGIGEQSLADIKAEARRRVAARRGTSAA
ncbi:ribbon-helix-helix domain-containing protein [Jiella mangrovi]|uniref:Type II toxin-antitoxin system ParD family antitoxin n=1 Tax=Jiella mangrovi TaxID=2821407 RepID=A0ABS4BL01_9HYPH|nr:type II toxin-antitoxin system ParD family antitoxin [Jiella mangrovi]MBP0617212.1 type II toxin-antitoxin system ParD family antitoxin [Jiella mangrovi]